MSSARPGTGAAARPRDSSSAASETKPEEGGALERALLALGPFGFYQRYSLALLCLPNLLAAMYSLNYVFVADQVPFRCLIPECESPETAQFNDSWASTLLAETTTCRRPAPLATPLETPANCTLDQFDHEQTVPCEQFVYESMKTTFSEFNLGCREWLRTLVGTVRNSALPLALILTGFVSDKYGRLKALCAMSACAGALGLLKSFSVSYPMYLSVEFLEAMLGYGFNSAAYVMMIELARPSQRSAFACLSGVTYGVGGMLLALVAWGTARGSVRGAAWSTAKGGGGGGGGWRTLLRIIHAPALLLPLYWLALDESLRWLHANGDTRRTTEVLKKVARWNTVQLSEKLVTDVEEETRRASREAVSEGSAWSRVVRSRVLVARLALCGWCWAAAAFVYYGLTINSVALSGDKYVNFALNMSMEVVASLLIVMALERCGRKYSVFVAFLVCGVACVTPYFIAHTRAGFSLFFVGKLSITFAFNALYVWTSELFPTRVRSSALAACSLLGRAGSVLAPQTPLLAVVYGGAALSAATLVLLAPETRRRALPTSAADAEALSPGSNRAATI